MSKMISKVEKRCYVWEASSQYRKDEVRRTVCQDLSLDYMHEGHQYCLMHYPSVDKGNVFQEEFARRILEKRYNFEGVYFPDSVQLQSHVFDNEVNFSRACFSGYAAFNKTIFKQSADFALAKFEGEAQFDLTTFNDEANFQGVEFLNSVSFGGMHFIGDACFVQTMFVDWVNFSDTTFDKYVSFEYAKFKENSDVTFEGSTFNDQLVMSSVSLDGALTFGLSRELRDEYERSNRSTNFCSCPGLTLNLANIKHPAQILFNSMRLQVSSFVQVDASKFAFFSCHWEMPNGKRLNTRTELLTLKELGFLKCNDLLSQACGRLADNYEENKGYQEASMFRQMANEAKRFADYNGLAFWRLHWWYWLSSNYGESWIRALAVVVAIIAIFLVFYLFLPFQVCPLLKPGILSGEQILCEVRTLNVVEAFMESLFTATFQNPEFQKPATIFGEMVRIVEKIMIPIQAALLALAIRRKFMR